MDKVLRLHEGDYDELLDFINLVFSQGGQPHDFMRLLPKLYQPDEAHMACHYAIRADGRLRAVVGAYPNTLHIGDTTLLCRDIGAVSTHKEYRNRHYMRALMEAIAQDMARDGIQLSVLGGERLRYQRYGYELGGQNVELRFSAKGLAAAPEYEALPLRFEPLAEAELPFVEALQRRQPLYVERPEPMRSLTSWYMHPVLARLDGQPVGWMTVNQEQNRCGELVADTAEHAAAMVWHWTKAQGGFALGSLAPWQTEEARRLGVFATGLGLRGNAQYRVLDFPALLRAMLELKLKLRPSLPEGEACFEIEGCGPLRLWVKDAACGLEPLPTPAALRLSHHEALRLFSLPLPVEMTAPLPSEAALLGSWCPLPLHIPSPDHV